MGRPVRMLFDDIVTFTVKSSMPIYWTITCEKTAGGARVYVTPCTKQKTGERAYTCHWSLSDLAIANTEDSARLWKAHPDVYTLINTDAARDKIIGLLWKD